MELITRDHPRASDIQARLRFSLRNAVGGFFVVVGYAVAIGWMHAKTNIPLPIVGVSAAVWVLFVLYWARNLRRVATSSRFALAVTKRAVLVPLAGVDKNLPPELNLLLEVPRVDIQRMALETVTTRLRHRPVDGTGVAISSISIRTLRLHLRDDVVPALTETLAKVRRLNGLQDGHLHVPNSRTVEVFLTGLSPAAIQGTLRALDPTIELTPTSTVLATDELSEAEWEAAAARLESRGETLRVQQARDFRGRAKQ